MMAASMIIISLLHVGRSTHNRNGSNIYKKHRGGSMKATIRPKTIIPKGRGQYDVQASYCGLNTASDVFHYWQ